MTDEEIGYKRINCGVCMFPDYFKIQDGKQVWNPHFMEHLNDCNNLFTDLFKGKIIASIGEFGWAINFVQFSQESVTWLVDIYLDKPEYYNLVSHIVIDNKPKEFNFQYYYRGNLALYIGSQ